MSFVNHFVERMSKELEYELLNDKLVYQAFNLIHESVSEEGLVEIVCSLIRALVAQRQMLIDDQLKALQNGLRFPPIPVTDVYLIMKRVVCEHGVHGVFFSESQAIDACRKVALTDVDDRCRWGVTRVPIGAMSSDGRKRFDGEDWDGFDGADSVNRVFETTKEKEENGHTPE